VIRNTNLGSVTAQKIVIEGCQSNQNIAMEIHIHSFKNILNVLDIMVYTGNK
jgi:hypothetical protein